ncbi:DJ-1/PfpI family protein, partial [Kibdelosporangium lantanae]
TRKIAVLAADGVDGTGTRRLVEVLRDQGAIPEVLAPVDGTVTTSNDADLDVDRAIATVSSVLYDAVVIPAGEESVRTILADGSMVNFVAEAAKHAKAVGAFGNGVEVLHKAGLAVPDVVADEVAVNAGMVVTTAGDNSLPDEFLTAFVSEVGKHRAWERDTKVIRA